MSGFYGRRADSFSRIPKGGSGTISRRSLAQEEKEDVMAMPLSEISALSDLYYDEAESGAFSMGPSQIERSRRGNGVSFGPEGSAWARDDTLHSGSSASFLGGYGRGTETQIDETRADASPTSGVDPRWVTVFGFPR